MIIEATKSENGFLIPFIGAFQHLKQESILLDIKIVPRPQINEDYSALDQLVGLCETGKTDASINHDKVIYSKPSS